MDYIYIYGYFNEQNFNGKFEDKLNQEIVHISSSFCSIHVVLKNGESYSFGNNIEGALGIGKLDFANSGFKKVKINDLIKEVYCGNEFTIWKNVENKLYISGKGYGFEPCILMDKKINHLDVYEKTLCFIDENDLVRIWWDFINDKKDVEFKMPSKPDDIKCGNSFVIVKCNIFVYKIDISGEIKSLINLKSWGFRCSRANKIKASNNYALVLDDENNCWLYGKISPSLIRKNTDKPIAINIENMFALPNSVFFINNNGTTLYFGENEHGQLGDGTNERKYRTMQSNIYNVKFITGGNSFSVFVCKQFDSSLLSFCYDDFVPGQLNCTFESPDDILID